MSTVEVAPGDGWLACRSGALLWCPDPSRPDALLAAFVDAPDAESTRAAVTDAVVGAALDVPAFALVTWTGDLHVVVMGAVDVETDAPSLPLLSGATSRTWVEHGVVGTAPVEVVAGGRPGAGTDVGDGVVRAGGFRLTATPGWVAAPRRWWPGRRRRWIPTPTSCRSRHPSRRRRDDPRCSTSSPVATGWRTASASAHPVRSSPRPPTWNRRRSRHRASPRARSRSLRARAPPAIPTRRRAPPASSAGISSISPRHSSRWPSRSWRCSWLTTVSASPSPARSSSAAVRIRRPPASRTRPSSSCSPSDRRVTHAPRRARRRVDDHRHRLWLAPRHRARASRRRAGAPRAVDVSRGANRRRTAPWRPRRDPPRGACSGGVLPIVAVTLYELGRTVSAGQVGAA